MVKITFIYKQSDPLTNYLLSQLEIIKNNKEAIVLKATIEVNPNYIERYNLKYNHTLLFTDFHETELYRLEGPFNKEDITGIIKKLNEAGGKKL